MFRALLELSQLQIQELERQELERQEKLTEKYRISRRIKAGIPKRYLNLKFDSYHTNTKNQNIIKSSCIDFTKKILSGKIVGSLIFDTPLKNNRFGNGKTMLASIIIENILAYKEDAECKIITAGQLLSDVKSTYSPNSEKKESSVINYFSKLDLLVLDEAHRVSKTEDNMKILFNVIDNRYQEMKPTILIANTSVNELQDIIGSAVISRLKQDGGKVLSFTETDQRK